MIEREKRLLEASELLKEEILGKKTELDNLKKENEELKDSQSSGSFMHGSPMNLRRVKTKSFHGPSAFRGSLNLESTLSNEDITKAENTLDSEDKNGLLSDLLLVCI